MQTYKVHYTADVWEFREIEADSFKEARDKFESGDWGDSDPAEQMGMENLKVDVVENEKGEREDGSKL